MAEGEQPARTEVLRSLGALEEAERRAYDRGQESARVHGELRAHESRLNSLNGSVARAADELRAVGDKLTVLSEQFRRGEAIAKDRAEQAERLVKKSLGTREFVLGLIGATGVIVSALAATGHI